MRPNRTAWLAGHGIDLGSGDVECDYWSQPLEVCLQPKNGQEGIAYKVGEGAASAKRAPPRRPYILRDFIRISGGARSVVLSFVRRYGPLHLNELGMPDPELIACEDIFGRSSHLRTRWNWEPIDGYRRWAASLAAAIRIEACMVRDEPPFAEDIKAILGSWPVPGPFADVFRDLPRYRERAVFPKTSDPSVFGPAEITPFRPRLVLRAWFRQMPAPTPELPSHLNLGAEWRRIGNPYSAIGLQLHRALMNSLRLDWRCAYCGRRVRRTRAPRKRVCCGAKECLRARGREYVAEHRRRMRMVGTA